MPVLAKDTEAGHIYKPTRTGSFPRVYFTVHKTSADKFLERLERRNRKKGLNGRESGLLTSMKRHPDWILLQSHHRGVDPFTGQKFELKLPVLLPPDFRLREVQAKPGYR